MCAQEATDLVVPALHDLELSFDTVIDREDIDMMEIVKVR